MRQLEIKEEPRDRGSGQTQTHGIDCSPEINLDCAFTENRVGSQCLGVPTSRRPVDRPIYRWKDAVDLRELQLPLGRGSARPNVMGPSYIGSQGPLWAAWVYNYYHYYIFTSLIPIRGKLFQKHHWWVWNHVKLVMIRIKEDQRGRAHNMSVSLKSNEKINYYYLLLLFLFHNYHCANRNGINLEIMPL